MVCTCVICVHAGFFLVTCRSIKPSEWCSHSSVAESKLFFFAKQHAVCLHVYMHTCSYVQSVCILLKSDSSNHVLQEVYFISAFLWCVCMSVLIFRLPFLSRAAFDIISRLLELAAAIWFPCCLWNCKRSVHQAKLFGQDVHPVTSSHHLQQA